MYNANNCITWHHNCKMTTPAQVLSCPCNSTLHTPRSWGTVPTIYMHIQHNETKAGDNKAGYNERTVGSMHCVTHLLQGRCVVRVRNTRCSQHCHIQLIQVTKRLVCITYKGSSSTINITVSLTAPQGRSTGTHTVHRELWTTHTHTHTHNHSEVARYKAIYRHC